MLIITASGAGRPIPDIPEKFKRDGFCFQKSLWLLTGVESALQEWPNFYQIAPELAALQSIRLYRFYSNLTGPPVPCTVSDFIQLGYGAITRDALFPCLHGSWLVHTLDVELYNASGGGSGGHWIAVRDGFTTEFNEWYPLDNWIVDFRVRAVLRRIYEVGPSVARDPLTSPL